MIDTLGVLTRTVEPTVEPFTLEELAQQVRASTAIDDLLLWRYGQRARAALEDAYRVAFLPQTWTWRLDAIDDACLYVPLIPVASVSSIAYVDSAGASQTWTGSLYQVQTSPKRRTRIAPAYGESWPDYRSETFGAVTVTFVAGWASAAALPLPLRQAVLMYTAFLYTNRGDSGGAGATTVGVSSREMIPPAVDSLMSGYGLELYV